MSCLKPEELMSLIYMEGKPEDLIKYKAHIKSCSNCFDEFMEINEVRASFKNEKVSSKPQVIVIKSKEREYGYGTFAVAALFLFTIALSFFTSNSVSKMKNQQKVIVAKQATIDNDLAKTKYLMEDYSKQNYMLMMGLKDYFDNNMKTLKVNYEKF